jgi:signal peptidase II
MENRLQKDFESESRCCWGKGWVAFVTVLFFWALDQATKWWTVRHFALGDRKMIWGEWFEWVHFSNTGAAFGILQDSNRFFIGLSVTAALGVIFLLKRNVFPLGLNFAALLLLLPGILGNLADRILHGYVVDFLLLDLGFYPANPWPAFNVADSCICVAVGLMLIASIQEEYARRKTPRDEG